MANFVPPTPEISLDEGSAAYERDSEVYQVLQSRGFVRASLPQVQTSGGVMPFRGDLPPNLTQLTDEQLGDLLGLCERWHGYVQDQLAEMEMIRNKCLAQLTFIESKVRLTYKTGADGTKTTVDERKDLVKVDRRYVSAHSEFLRNDDIYTFIKGIAESAYNTWQTVSRRITQRGQDIETGRRGQNIGSQQFPQGPLFRRQGG